MVIDSHLAGARLDGALVYGCVEPEGADFAPGRVAADVFLPGEGRVRMTALLDSDGKADWERELAGNPYTYRQLYERLEGVGPEDLARERAGWESRRRPGR